MERRDQRAWLSICPSLGKGVLVTRPRHQAAGLIRRLEILGSRADLLPAVEIRDPPDWTPVDRALGELDRTVGGFYQQQWGPRPDPAFAETGRAIRAPGNRTAGGHRTEHGGSLRQLSSGPETDAADQQFRSPGRLCWPRKPRTTPVAGRADRGRDVLRQELSMTATVEQVAVYSQVDTLEVDVEGLEASCAGKHPPATLTSSNIARAGPGTDPR